MQNLGELPVNIIIGRNPVMEALKSGRNIEYILTCFDKPSGSLIPIVSKAKDLGVEIRKTSKEKLNLMSREHSHQGVIAISSVKKYSSVNEILNLAYKKQEDPFIIIASGIEDPRNLGAIIRTAECSGAHGVIIPKRNAVGLNSSVEKTSSGALEHILVAKETNISSTIKKLKQQNIWIFGADASGENLYKRNFKGPIAIVVGSEGKGLSRIVKENCDCLVSIPMFGKINSLNVSVASAVIMYEVVRQKFY